jgi:hypothetical protein
LRLFGGTLPRTHRVSVHEDQLCPPRRQSVARWNRSSGLRSPI